MKQSRTVSSYSMRWLKKRRRGTQGRWSRSDAQEPREDYSARKHACTVIFFHIPFSEDLFFLASGASRTPIGRNAGECFRNSCHISNIVPSPSDSDVLNPAVKKKEIMMCEKYEYEIFKILTRPWGPWQWIVLLPDLTQPFHIHLLQRRPKRCVHQEKAHLLAKINYW